MEIYAPLANRLGIWQFKSELEDLAFRYLDPRRTTTIERALERPRCATASATSTRVIAGAARRARSEGIKAEITGRAKHIYSICAQDAAQGAHASTRSTTSSASACIVAGDRQGLLRRARHHPLDVASDPGRVRRLHRHAQREHVPVAAHRRDRAGGPRRSRSRSAPSEMHEIAEYGIAAHWRYKEGAKRRRQRRGQGRLAAADDGVARRGDGRARSSSRSLKSDVFQEMIYVFTPKGDIIELPAGATPVDFAYRIHTEVGHHMRRRQGQRPARAAGLQAAERRRSSRS